MYPAEEREFRNKELDFRERELELLTKDLQITSDNNRRQHRLNTRVMVLTAAGVILSTILSVTAIIVGFRTANAALREGEDQFEKTSRATYFQSIVDGLDSESVAVQATSMRLLSEYVRDVSNYAGDKKLQSDGTRDALQTLAAFISDKSNDIAMGLPDYSGDLPLVIRRAIRQIKDLAEDPSLGSHDTDLTEASLHGIDLSGFRPNGSFYAYASDLRRASLANLDLRSQPDNDLHGAFLTCADLRGAHLGSANVQYTDFAGSDLRGTDLGSVKNLTSSQLTGAEIDGTTVLPRGLKPPAGHPWAVGSDTCLAVVGAMTGMIAEQGYLTTLPCPKDVQKWPYKNKRLTTELPKQADIVSVCAKSQRPVDR